MSELEQIVGMLHSSIMNKFNEGACGEVSVQEALSCVKRVFEQLGFEIRDIRLFTLEGEETEVVDKASYIRVEAIHELSKHLDVVHIFTLALIKRKDKLKIMFLQSAVKVK